MISYTVYAKERERLRKVIEGMEEDMESLLFKLIYIDGKINIDKIDKDDNYLFIKALTRFYELSLCSSSVEIDKYIDKFKEIKESEEKEIEQKRKERGE